MTTTNGGSGWWPQGGLPESEIQKRLEQAQNDILSYNNPNTPAVSFPGATAIPAGINAWEMFAGCHPNNIGLHTAGQIEKGFMGTQQLEREAIYMAAAMMRAKDPEAEIDGYIASGGTGGTIQSLWMGRNAHQLAGGPDTPIIVLTTEMTHNSVYKACDILALTSARSFGRHRFVTIGINSDGSMDMNQLSDKIKHYLRVNSHTRFIIVPTLGTAMTGSADDLMAIDEIVNQFGPDKFWVHLDAAQGGFVYPFLYPDMPICFDVPCVRTTVVDVHKMGRGPYPSALFMCRKGEMERLTAIEVKYINEMLDGTVLGSRSGAMAAAVWTILKTMGWNGFKQMNESCMEVTRWLHSEIAKSSLVVGLTNPIVNQLAFTCDSVILTKGKEPGRLPEDVECDLCLSNSPHRNPLDAIDGKMNPWYKLPVMPDKTPEHYTSLLKHLGV